MSKKLSTLEKQMADLEAVYKKKQSQIKEQMRDAKAREKGAARKIDTRRKILAGAFMLHHCEVNPNSDLAQKLAALLDEYLIKDQDRNLFDLPPIPKDEQIRRKKSQNEATLRAKASFEAAVANENENSRQAAE